MNSIKDNLYNRRGFIKKLVFLFLSMEIAYLFFDYLKNKKDKITEDEWYNIGDLDNFECDKFYPFSKGGFFLYKQNDGGLLALSHKCTHLGCAIQIDDTEDGFHCPCHASNFNKYGEVKSPPAARALDILPIKIQGRSIYVNIIKPMKRNGFEKSQLTYA